MRRMNLTGQELREYHRVLKSNHTVEIRGELLDLNGDRVGGGDLTGRIVDGQLTVDTSREVVRSAEIDILDPGYRLRLDTESPMAGALFADRMIRVWYDVITPDGSTRYPCPLFTGPVVGMDRSGAVLQLECQGKEALAMSPVWRARTWRKGTRVTTVIREIMEMCGETDMRIPDWKVTLKRNVSVGGDKKPWTVARRLADNLDCQIWYDGFGVLRFRKYRTNPVFTYDDGPGGAILTRTEAGFDAKAIVNAVEVWGRDPSRGAGGRTRKKRPHARVAARPGQGLSPRKLRRGGVDGYRPLVVPDDSISNDKEARQRAKKELKRALLDSVEISFDALVIPHLEELDVVAVSTEEFSARMRVRKFAVPFDVAGVSALGYVRNVRPNKRAIRRPRRRR